MFGFTYEAKPGHFWSFNGRNRIVSFATYFAMINANIILKFGTDTPFRLKLIT